MLSFCLHYFKLITSRPNDIVPPVWLFISLCTAYEASTQVSNSIGLSAASTRSSSIVDFRKCKRRRNLVQSCSVHFDNLVHKNAVVNTVSGRPRFPTHNSFITTLPKYSIFSYGNGFDSLSISNKPFSAGVAAPLVSGCLKSSMASTMCSRICICTVPSPGNMDQH